MYDVGQKPLVYAYAEIENAPDYVDLADAREIYENEDFLVHKEKGTPAIHSDIFRVLLCQKTPHIWVDTDAYLYKPLEATEGYLVGRLNEDSVLTGIFRLPQLSAALTQMAEYLTGPYQVPPWWDEERKAAAADFTSFIELRWGATGPDALTHFMISNDELKFTLDPKVLYPIRSRKIKAVCQSPRMVLPALDSNTVSLHLYGSFLRRILIRRGESEGPRSNSYLGRLCSLHGIDPSTAPIV